MDHYRQGTCAACKRSPMSLIGRGLCGRCYSRPEIRAAHPTRGPKKKTPPEPDPDLAEADLDTPEALGRQLTELEHLRMTWFGGLAA